MTTTPDTKMPRPLDEASRDVFSQVEAVFFDIDDTFSGGRGQPRITADAYDALWKLYEAGFKVVPVTGRPAGWCDMIARMWPVTAVIGENGAFYVSMDYSQKPPKLVKKYLEPQKIRDENARKLKRLKTAVLKEFPGAKTPSDQLYREFDLAIDFCEDVPRWPDKKVQKLLEFCRSKGATAKLSSIHVNTWFGKYDKLKCVQRMLSQVFHLRISNIVYIGDSPNDEPFFEKVPFSVGVANVREFLGHHGKEKGAELKFAPAYITKASSGLGFAELAEKLLKLN